MIDGEFSALLVTKYDRGITAHNNIDDGERRLCVMIYSFLINNEFIKVRVHLIEAYIKIIFAELCAGTWLSCLYVYM